MPECYPGREALSTDGLRLSAGSMLMYMGLPDGKEFKSMENRYVRVK